MPIFRGEGRVACFTPSHEWAQTETTDGHTVLPWLYNLLFLIGIPSQPEAYTYEVLSWLFIIFVCHAFLHISEYFWQGSSKITASTYNEWE